MKGWAWLCLSKILFTKQMISHSYLVHSVCQQIFIYQALFLVWGMNNEQNEQNWQDFCLHGTSILMEKINHKSKQWTRKFMLDNVRCHMMINTDLKEKRKRRSRGVCIEVGLKSYSREPRKASLWRWWLSKSWKEVRKQPRRYLGEGGWREQ